MPKLESPAIKAIELTAISNRKTERANKEFLLKQQKNQQQFTYSKPPGTSKQTQKNVLLIDLDQSDVMKTYTQLVDQNIQTKFRISYYLLQTVLSYGILIGINYLSQLVYYLPYFLMVTIFSFFRFLQPFLFEHLLIFSCFGFIIGNSVLNIQFNSYPIILIIFISIAVFQKNNKVKNLLPVIVILLLFVYGYILLPLLYQNLNSFQYGNLLFIYIFPFVDIIIQLIIDILYFISNKPKILLFQFYLFMLGVDFGIAMSLPLINAEFWYLCVALTFKIVNSRTQFLLGFFARRLQKLAFLNLNSQRKIISYKGGFLLKQLIPSVGIIYLYSLLGFTNPPFSNIPSNLLNLYNIEWFKPILYGGINFIYNLLTLNVNSRIGYKKKILMQYESGSIKRIISYAIVNVFGYWIFYMGYLFQSVIIKYR